MNILVINGPNINMLGIREQEIYGKDTYQDLVNFISDSAKELDISVLCLQSNHEGEIVTMIQNALGKFDGIVINPAAYTHTSIAILDALKAVCLPTVEVHLSNIKTREDFRKQSFVSIYAHKTIHGKGFAGYKEALAHLKSMNAEEKDPSAIFISQINDYIGR